jgi:hypothetical protein
MIEMDVIVRDPGLILRRKIELRRVDALAFRALRRLLMRLLKRETS